MTRRENTVYITWGTGESASQSPAMAAEAPCESKPPGIANPAQDVLQEVCVQVVRAVGAAHRVPGTPAVVARA